MDINNELLIYFFWLFLVKETPTGQIPVLTTQCGKKIVQTTAILRYVATELNLMGECNGQRALIDGIVVTHKEIHDAAVDIAFFTKEEEKVRMII